MLERIDLTPNSQVPVQKRAKSPKRIENTKDLKARKHTETGQSKNEEF
jgi:hypothetical protein